MVDLDICLAHSELLVQCFSFQCFDQGRPFHHCNSHGYISGSAWDPVSDMSEEKKKNEAKRTLFVRGLPWDMDGDALCEYFKEQVGDCVSVRMVTDKETGASKGVAFVAFSRKPYVALAMASKHFVDGKMLELKDQAMRDAEWDEEKVKEDAKRKLTVRNLPWDTNDQDLYTYFQDSVGEVEYARVVIDKETGESRGFGFVVFETEALHFFARASDEDSVWGSR